MWPMKAFSAKQEGSKEHDENDVAQAVGDGWTDDLPVNYARLCDGL